MRLPRSGHALRNGMRAVLLISMGSLISQRFASSANGSLAPSFNSTLFGDVMATAWVQKDANWDGFLSSHLGQLNSPGRNTLETFFSFFKLPLNFSDQRRKSKTHVPEETPGEPSPGPSGLIRPGRPACLGSQASLVWFFACPNYFAFSAHEKKMAR
jgi:hypothetical protein